MTPIILRDLANLLWPTRQGTDASEMYYKRNIKKSTTENSHPSFLTLSHNTLLHPSLILTEWEENQAKPSPVPCLYLLLHPRGPYI